MKHLLRYLIPALFFVVPTMMLAAPSNTNHSSSIHLHSLTPGDVYSAHFKFTGASWILEGEAFDSFDLEVISYTSSPVYLFAVAHNLGSSWSIPTDCQLLPSDGYNGHYLTTLHLDSPIDYATAGGSDWYLDIGMGSSCGTPSNVADTYAVNGLNGSLGSTLTNYVDGPLGWTPFIQMHTYVAPAVPQSFDLGSAIPNTVGALQGVCTIVGEIFLALFFLIAGVGLLAAGILWGYRRIVELAIRYDDELGDYHAELDRDAELHAEEIAYNYESAYDLPSDEVIAEGNAGDIAYDTDTERQLDSLAHDSF